MNFLTILFVITNPSITWKMTCKHYQEAVESLYSDPYFQKESNRLMREQIHFYFKTKTHPSCHITET